MDAQNNYSPNTLPVWGENRSGLMSDVIDNSNELTNVIVEAPMVDPPHPRFNPRAGRHRYKDICLIKYGHITIDEATYSIYWKGNRMGSTRGEYRVVTRSLIQQGRLCYLSGDL